MEENIMNEVEFLKIYQPSNNVRSNWWEIMDCIRQMQKKQESKKK